MPSYKLIKIPDFQKFRDFLFPSGKKVMEY